jgi:hypothetical protein
VQRDDSLLELLPPHAQQNGVARLPIKSIFFLRIKACLDFAGLLVFARGSFEILDTIVSFFEPAFQPSL